MSRLVTEDDIVSAGDASGNRLVWGSVSHLREQAAVCFQAVKSLTVEGDGPARGQGCHCLSSGINNSIHLPRDVVPCDEFLLYYNYMNVVSIKMDLALRKKSASTFSLSVAFEDL